jgi:hypothetical protein
MIVSTSLYVNIYDTLAPMSDKRFYVMAIYIAPGCKKGVEDLRNAWAQCPTNCTPIVIGDLNIRNQDPRDAREEEIVDLLDEINLVDTSRKFIQRQSC